MRFAVHVGRRRDGLRGPRDSHDDQQRRNADQNKPEIAPNWNVSGTWEFRRRRTLAGERDRGSQGGLSLPRLRSGPASCRQIMLVKRLPDQVLDYRPVADVQLLRGVVPLIQRWRGEVNIHKLDLVHHVPRVRENARPFRLRHQLIILSVILFQQMCSPLLWCPVRI